MSADGPYANDCVTAGGNFVYSFTAVTTKVYKINGGPESGQTGNPVVKVFSDAGLANQLAIAPDNPGFLESVNFIPGSDGTYYVEISCPDELKYSAWIEVAYNKGADLTAAGSTYSGSYTGSKSNYHILTATSGTTYTITLTDVTGITMITGKTDMTFTADVNDTNSLNNTVTFTATAAQDYPIVTDNISGTPDGSYTIKCFIQDPSYAQKVSSVSSELKFFSALGLTMTVYPITCSRFFCKHPPRENLIQGFDDNIPNEHQSSFSPLQ